MKKRGPVFCKLEIALDAKERPVAVYINGTRIAGRKPPGLFACRQFVVDKLDIKDAIKHDFTS